MKLKPKNIFWYLTFPFAHSNYTAIGNTIYHPKNKIPSQRIVNHEMIHQEQQKKVGFYKFMFLYIFCLPLFYNPWRFKWEFEAYTKGTGISEDQTRKILKSYQYGWL